MATDPKKRFADATALRRAFEDLLTRIERSPSAVLVAFLRARKRLTESEALARLSHTELTQLSPQELSAVRGPRWGLALLVGVLLGVGVASFEQWWPRIAQLVADLRR